MTPAALRAICDSLGWGGQTKLARLLDYDSRTIPNKLSGKSRIAQSDGACGRLTGPITSIRVHHLGASRISRRA
jgi:hypothetical protein